MPINYPINIGGGSSGNATQIQGRNITTSIPSNGSIIAWSDSENKFVYNKEVLQTIFAGSASCSSTSETVLTKFYPLPYEGNPISDQYASFLIYADITNPHTGSIKISGSEGNITEYQITNSNFVFITQAPITGTHVYTVYASSSNASSNFIIYNLLASITK